MQRLDRTPGNGETRPSDNDGEQARSVVQPPSLTLPKGGGAIRGIGEKFAANPVTGTGSMSVPIAITPGRADFGPQLALTYDSGSGNGPFGFGWNLSLPSITRKTDKGLPKYQDGEASDTFILSGAEDLVPILSQPEDVPDRTISADTYRITRYRPRIEGSFARIERWTHTQTHATHWRSISRDNIVTVYGRTADSRIEDPSAPAGAPRIFSWLICESYDDKGNAIYYQYERENAQQINASFIHERHRTDTRSANHYLKRIKYGNKTPVAPASTAPREFREDLSERMDWLFEVVFDYEEGHYEVLPAEPDGRQLVHGRINPTQDWQRRQDPFSSYRAGFEVRTYRLCRRILMFHHFPAELGVDDALVRATEFTYRENPIASFMTSVTQSGFKHQNNETYLKKSLPPLEFDYSEAIIRDNVQDVDGESLENLPQGLDSTQYQWADIDGEGLSGILTEQGDSWFYKRNVSALPIPDADGNPQVMARFAPLERLGTLPSLSNLSGGRQQLLDLAGDGQLDVVAFDGPTPGLYERTQDEDWHPFQPFVSLPNIAWQEPNLKFVDLTGDGHADLFLTEDKAFTWYPSLAETGFAAGEKVHQAVDEEKGPKLVFADGTQSLYLADMSGDGLTDLVRIRNGEVCYWPNLGYGRFGAKVTMDQSPYFDAPDLFDQRRIRLADIDGSGITDMIYLKGDGVYIYLNESGNGWADAETLTSFPQIDHLSSVIAVDLLGNGTACLVWSSPLPAVNGRSLRYIDLMGGQKPHLLVAVKNNLGAETHVHYAPSTKFYLADKVAGKPWMTKLPFPVHVVERVETYDRISRNRFVTRSAYHHGYFDGIEREFRGFGMVEQWDSEEFTALSASRELPDSTNISATSHVPPILTKTWFHTGAYFEGETISRQFARAYYCEGNLRLEEAGLTDEQLNAMLLPDTVLPGTIIRPDGSREPWPLSPDETRQAHRALKDAILRQEVYALDGSEEADRPYSVSERNYTIEMLQPSSTNQHAVFSTYPRETIEFHYERKLYEINDKQLADPRVSHAMTLAVDFYGNVLKSVAIGYGRRHDDPDPSLTHADRDKQKCTLITLTEHYYTDPIAADDVYRTPLPCEIRAYELLKVTPKANLPQVTNLFGFEEMVSKTQDASDGQHDLPYEDVDGVGVQGGAPFRRLIEHTRTLYREDDLTALLPLGKAGSLALPYESYTLAFTPGHISQVYGNRVTGDMLLNEGRYVHSEGDDNWWIPSGRIFYAPNANDTAAQELTFAQQHFFLPHRFHDPFEQVSTISYDSYDQLITQTIDPVGNVVTAEHDYRVLQPKLMTDPNGNRSEVVFDALGMVAGTAVMGKTTETLGDTLSELDADLTQAEIDAFYDADDPHLLAAARLKGATTRVIYDPDRFRRTHQLHPDDPSQWRPVYAAALARETHVSDLGSGQQSEIQISFAYSDGFGREIQQKIQAEPGPVVAGGPDVSPRWVSSGWTIFNNKGNPVRQYEPFFDDTHDFTFGKQVGVSPILFYDPVERVVATLHPNHTYDKVAFDPWRQGSWDVNDTVALDPRTDADVKGFTAKYFESEPEDWETWLQQRIDPQNPPPDAPNLPPEQSAAVRALAHNDTPTIAYFDTLGRPFLTIADNGKDGDGEDIRFETRTELDIEGTPLRIIDARGNAVMEYRVAIESPADGTHFISAYDIAGRQLYQKSMDAGERWSLPDIAEKPLYAWNSRGHRVRYSYDELQRPTHLFVQQDNDTEKLAERTVYGESHPNRDTLNLRGQVYLQLDGAGLLTGGGFNPETNQEEAYDFKGNLLRASRRLAREYKQQLDWSGIDSALHPNPNTETLDLPAIENAIASLLEDNESFVTSTTYDALNRVVTQITPDGSITRPGYNEANLLENIEMQLRGSQITTIFVENIDYNARGQRTQIDYGNNVTTRYEYDDETFRLRRLLTIRNNSRFAEDDKQSAQDLRYTYDPVGNITRIYDHADIQNVIYFRNQRVDPSSNYTYDPLYRLIEASGREHLGQTSGSRNPPVKPTHHDRPRTGPDGFGLNHPGDGNAMGQYTEHYEYDSVGNILAMRHRGTNPAHPGWKRCYQYAIDSNRLLSTSGPNDLPNPDSPCVLHYAATPVYADHYEYDDHGNMTKMPHLPVMEWDFEDQLHVSQRQVVNEENGVGERTYYVYDAAGQRVRKVTEHKRENGEATRKKDERVYLGSFEIYRRYNGNGTTKTLERETLHIMDDTQRVAMVETKIIDTDNDPSPTKLVRYQFGNHLGSVSLELDDDGEVISYEEYFPYGSTAYQAADKNIKAAVERYRYTGKERDEESGLYYHGARYYACWLGRWTTVDPARLMDGPGLYNYVRGNPVVMLDPNGHEAEAAKGLQAIAEKWANLELEQRYKSGELSGPPPPPLRQADPGRVAFEFSQAEVHKAQIRELLEHGILVKSTDDPKRQAQLIAEGYIMLQQQRRAEEERKTRIFGQTPFQRAQERVQSFLGLPLSQDPSVGMAVGLAAAKGFESYEEFYWAGTSGAQAVSGLFGLAAAAGVVNAQPTRGGSGTPPPAPPEPPGVGFGSGSTAGGTRPGSGGTRAPRTLYHGTAFESAVRLLRGEALNPQQAARNKLDGPPGFFLATDPAVAEFFALRRGRGLILRYEFYGEAIEQLEAKGAQFGEIRPGKTTRFPGQEFVVPPEAFDLFNTLRKQGQIRVTPGEAP